MKKIICFLTIFLAFVWASSDLLTAGTEIFPDSYTVLLDHFNGSTLANNNYPPGTVDFAASLPGLEQALWFSSYYNIRYDLSSWYTGSGGKGTVEFLLKRQRNQMFLPVIFQWYRADYPPGGGGWIGVIRVYDDGRFSWWEWGSPSPVPELFCNKKLPLNEWTYIAVSWGPSGTKVYFNDQVEGFVNAVMGPYMLTNTYIYVGAAENSAMIDELHISKSQRSDEEILEHAQQLLPSDTTPPEISISADPSLLWPPNHKMITVHATVSVFDDFDPAPQWQLLAITSNEPEEGSGKKNSPDILGHELGTPDTEFQLRAERAGKGTGRVYTITYEATDAAGNSATAQAEVVVPHDLGKPLPLPGKGDKISSSDFQMFQNFPNPFNAETQIQFQLPQFSKVEIIIYDVRGRLVRHLFSGEAGRGRHILIWDSENDKNQDVPSGVYFVKLRSDQFVRTKKIMLIR